MEVLSTTKCEGELNLIIWSLTGKNICPFHALQINRKDCLSFRPTIRVTIILCKVGFRHFLAFFSIGEQECTNCKLKLCIDTTLQKQSVTSRISLNSQSIFLGYTRFNRIFILTSSMNQKVGSFSIFLTPFLCLEYGPPERNETEQTPSTLKTTLIGKLIWLSLIS